LFLSPVQHRNAALASSVSALHGELQSRSQDSADVLAYLETEVRRKDLVTKQLGRELRELHAAQVAEKAQKQADYAAEIAALEQTFARAESELLDLNRLRHQEHNDLLLFSRIRGDLLAELGHTKRTIVKNERRHALQMSDLEKKFLAARQRLLEESAARIAASRKSYKEEVGRELDLESKWIHADNAKMAQERDFHQALIEKLQQGNAELSAIAAELEASVKELERKDAAYAAASLRNTKVLQELQHKHALLTSSLQQVQAEGQKQRAAEKQAKQLLNQQQQQQQQQLLAGADPSAALALLSVGGDAIDPSGPGAALVPLQMELGKLQSLSALKARENQALHRQLSLLRDQQSDVERVASAMLQRVKQEVCARRARHYEQAVAAYRQNLARLAEGMYQPRGIKALLPGAGSSTDTFAATSSLHIQSDPRLPPPVAPVTDPSKLRLEDLTLHERERVLQLLFEKLNENTTVGASGGNAGAKSTSEADSRPSSALSLYTGGGVSKAHGRSDSSTSLVLSRPQSSNRARPASSSSSRPGSSTRPLRPAAPASAAGATATATSSSDKPNSVSRIRPAQPPSRSARQQQQQPQQFNPSDMRPSDYMQLSGAATAAGSGGTLLRPHRPHISSSKLPQRGGDEKESPVILFPPRGDTPTELL
jgi:hypothetical protein